MVRRVCLVSGGTGGHLMPALVLSRALRDAGQDALLITEGREVEREILQREMPSLVEFQLPGGRPRRLTTPWWLLRGMVAARRWLQEQSIDAVVSTGGRPSLPVGLAARSLGLPLFLLEQNAVVGRANRWLLPLARRIYHGLPSRRALSRRALVTGTPLRPDFGRLERRAARAALGLALDVPVVVVTGGSQGAQVLNELVPPALHALGLPLQVVHLAGAGKDDQVRRLYAADPETQVRAVVRPVALDMDRLFSAADLVLCRGGGTTVAELAAAGRAAVIVPYPHHADQQQLRNAEVLARAGAAVVIEEKQLTATHLQEVLASLLRDAAQRRAMEQAAARTRSVDPTTAILRDLAAICGWQDSGPSCGEDSGPRPGEGGA